MENDSLAASSTKKEFEISRVINAPVDLVYRAWTDPNQLSKWWGPKDFTNPVCEIDIRPGGEIRIDMKGPDGTVYPMAGIFMEIIEPERLVFTSTAMQDENGTWQLEVFNTISFDGEEGNTKLTVNASVVKQTARSAPAIAGMEQGWQESLDKLNDLLKRPA